MSKEVSISINLTFWLCPLIHSYGKASNFFQNANLVPSPHPHLKPYRSFNYFLLVYISKHFPAEPSRSGCLPPLQPHWMGSLLPQHSSSTSAFALIPVCTLHKLFLVCKALPSLWLIPGSRPQGSFPWSLLLPQHSNILLKILLACWTLLHRTCHSYSFYTCVVNGLIIAHSLNKLIASRGQGPFLVLVSIEFPAFSNSDW